MHIVPKLLSSVYICARPSGPKFHVYSRISYALSPSLIHDKGRSFQVLSNEYSRESKCVKDALRWEDGMQKISSHSGNLLFYSGAKISRFSDVAKVCISFRSAFCSIFDIFLYLNILSTALSLYSQRIICSLSPSRTSNFPHYRYHSFACSHALRREAS